MVLTKSIKEHNVTLSSSLNFWVINILFLYSDSKSKGLKAYFSFINMTNLKTENDSSQYVIISSSPTDMVKPILDERGYSFGERDSYRKIVGNSVYSALILPNIGGWSGSHTVRACVGETAFEKFASGSHIHFQELTLEGRAIKEKRMSQRALSELCEVIKDARLGKVHVFNCLGEEYGFK